MLSEKHWRRSSNEYTVEQGFGLFSALILVFVLVYAAPWIAFDHFTYFVPAALKLITMQNPYDVAGFYNPPWALLPYVPMAICPYKWGQTVLFLASVSAIIFFCNKMNISTITTILFMTSYPVVSSLLYGNMEWLVFASVLFPPEIGIFLALVKPQVGIGLALLWGVERYREQGWKGVIRLYLPVAIVTGLSFLAYGFWPLHWLGAPTGGSFWPWLVPLALYYAQKMDIRSAFSVGPFLTSHLTRGSLAGVFLLLADHPWGMALASAAVWIGGVING